MISFQSMFHSVRTFFWYLRFPDAYRKKCQRQKEYKDLKEKLRDSALHSTQLGVTKELVSEKAFVVSLTTHGKRIDTVYLTIESLLLQTLRPNHLILYIGEEEYQSINLLPSVLQKQTKRGLTIRFVKDQRSYTKLLPALRDYPEACIITVDDDLLYPPYLLEQLVKAHLTHPEAICCRTSLTLSFTPDQHLQPFSTFSYEIPSYKDSISNRFLPEGFNGILYPPHSLSKEVFDEELFMQLSPTADDLWFKAMSLLAGTPILRLHNSIDLWCDIYREESVQDIALSKDNVDRGGNDIQLKALFDHYDLYRFFS